VSDDKLSAINAALSTVMDPELGRSMMELNMLRDIDLQGEVLAIRVVLTTPACPLKDRIAGDLEKAVVGKGLGVNSLSLKWDSDVSATRGIPGRQSIEGVKNAVAVASGKGGVGKTTVAVNLAIALSQTGAKVGLVDADVYGPNVPIMLGITEEPAHGTTKKIAPNHAYGISVISFGTILKPGQPVIWRGPMLAKALHEFLYEVEWGELDYLVIDLPPGTGDVQLSLAQSLPMTGAVICTTPQDVSLADVSRGIAMFKQLRVPVLGVVENMSGFVCPHCDEITEIFGSGGGETLAKELQIPFLGSIPLDPRIRIGGGDGQPLMAAAPDSPVGQIFMSVAKHIAGEVSKANFNSSAGPVMPSGPRIPLAR
jgi:ATP-binding protein involved in chromosome partitioning